MTTILDFLKKEELAIQSSMFAGGPGSGCNPQVGRCGKQASGNVAPGRHWSKPIPYFTYHLGADMGNGWKLSGKKSTGGGFIARYSTSTGSTSLNVEHTGQRGKVIVSDGRGNVLREAKNSKEAVDYLGKTFGIHHEHMADRAAATSKQSMKDWKERAAVGQALGRGLAESVRKGGVKQ